MSARERLSPGFPPATLRAVRYQGPIFRPPSEASSYILQVVYGCYAALEAYNLTGMPSTLVYFATYPMDFTIPVSPFMLYFKEMSIKGVFFSPYTFPRAIDMLPRLELEPLITKTLPLEQAATIMDLHETGREIKIMVQC